MYGRIWKWFYLGICIGEDVIFYTKQPNNQAIQTAFNFLRILIYNLVFMKRIFIIFVSLLFITNIYSQGMKKGYVQASLIYPFGTSWINSKEKQFNFSLNLLAGYTGQIKGVEIGTILNINKYNMHGIQIGMFNINKGDMKGFQVGPGVNWIEGEGMGANFSGLFTYQRGRFTGLEFSWFVNINGGDFRGGMGSHLLNFVQKDMYGIQWALGPNVVMGNNTGVQFSWSANVAAKSHHGFQAATLFNYAGESDGFQLAAINVAKKSAGFQLGLINYSGDSSVVPIGLINIVKGGYNKMEIWSNELTSFNLALKTGGRQVYSLISVGVNPFNKNFFWSFGWGPGIHIQFSKRFYGDFDNLTSLVNINEPFSFGAGRTTITDQIRLTCGFELTKKVALFLGPTLHFLFSNNNHLEHDGQYTANGTELAPVFRTALGHFGEFDYAIWTGVCGGIRFF